MNVIVVRSFEIGCVLAALILWASKIPEPATTMAVLAIYTHLKLKGSHDN